MDGCVRDTICAFGAGTDLVYGDAGNDWLRGATPIGWMVSTTAGRVIAGSAPAAPLNDGAYSLYDTDASRLGRGLEQGGAAEDFGRSDPG